MFNIPKSIQKSCCSAENKKRHCEPQAWQSQSTNTVCNKESKSVLYETLVVGTTTHGTAEKQNRSALKGTATQQNQRLNIAGVETPLTAVSTLTALLRNSTKVFVSLFINSCKPTQNNKCHFSATTSDACNKASTSVSYETLVVGTTTHGTAEKQNRSALKSTATQQNQRLNIAGAETPLTAVGTLTALLRNSTKVMEKFFNKATHFKVVRTI